jgi:TDG/mug DNA glycosylase family protein
MEVHKPTPKEIDAARGKKIPDVVAPGLQAVFCGINPSLYSAAIGHHFARPGNRFWPTMHRAGCTDRLLSPFEDRLLLDFGFGLTNICERATARGDELSTAELKKGGRQLERKIALFSPRGIAFLGITAYRAAFGERDAVIGSQARRIADVPVWVLPNPSGLNAHYQLPQLAELFLEMRQALAKS